jgi:hypothetical protein
VYFPKHLLGKKRLPKPGAQSRRHHPETHQTNQGIVLVESSGVVDAHGEHLSIDMLHGVTAVKANLMVHALRPIELIPVT